MATSPRARGADFKLYAKTETTAGTAPSGNWVQLPCFSMGLSGTQDLQSDAILSATAEVTRDAPDPYLDVINVRGDARVPIDLENTGHWLLMLFGAPTTTGSSDYTHVFDSGAVALPSKSFERNLNKITKMFLNTYVKADTMAIDFSPTGAADMTIGLMGQDDSYSGTSSAGTPTFAGMTRFHRKMGSTTFDGSAWANVAGATLRYGNGLEGVRTIRADSSLEAIDEGEATCTGTAKLRLADTSLLDDAIAGTPRALTFVYTISSVKSLTFALPRVFFSRPGVPISGPGGIEIDLNWAAAYDTTAGYMLRATLKNQIAAYA